MNPLKINLNTGKIAEIFKKNLYLTVIAILLAVFIYYGLYAYQQTKPVKIDESQLSAQEEKINESSYQKIIESNETKKSTESIPPETTKNPFKTY